MLAPWSKCARSLNVPHVFRRTYNFAFKYRCVNGHCESTSKNIGRSDGLKHNSLDGSWGSWSRWWFKDVDILNAINSYSGKKQKCRNKRKERVCRWPD